ncbi:MAG: hypothetical protein HUU10_04490 [Bacteroidetes bacterium]|nr:hypothetical protein [Bacteroidota bacterium]
MSRTILIDDPNAGIPVDAIVYRKDFDIDAVIDISTDQAKEALFQQGYDYLESRSENILGDGVQINITDPVTVSDALRIQKYALSEAQNYWVKPRQFKSIYKVTPRVIGLDSKVNSYYSGLVYYPSTPMDLTILDTAIELISRHNVKDAQADSYSVSYSSGNVTLTVNKVNHGRQVGHPIVVTGLSIAAYNLVGFITSVPSTGQFRITFPWPSNPGTPTGTLKYSSELFFYMRGDVQLKLWELNETPGSFLAEVYIRNQEDEGSISDLGLATTFPTDTSGYRLQITQNDGVTTTGDPTVDPKFAMESVIMPAGVTLDEPYADWFLLTSGVITNFTGFPG